LLAEQDGTRTGALHSGAVNGGSGLFSTGALQTSPALQNACLTNRLRGLWDQRRQLSLPAVSRQGRSCSPTGVASSTRPI